jgi:hypothetical protein
MSTNGKVIILNKTGVELICATDMEPEPICWLWTDWLATGKFHILAGAPGTGKTTIALNLAATITSGGQYGLARMIRRTHCYRDYSLKVPSAVESIS